MEPRFSETRHTGKKGGVKEWGQRKKGGDGILKGVGMWYTTFGENPIYAHQNCDVSYFRYHPSIICCVNFTIRYRKLLQSELEDRNRHLKCQMSNALHNTKCLPHHDDPLKFSSLDSFRDSTSFATEVSNFDALAHLTFTI